MENYIVFDIETTGLNPLINRITEIGAAKVINGEIVEVFNELINPEVLIPNNIVRLTGITNTLVRDMPTIADILPEFIEFCEDYPIIGHNILFDFSFIKINAIKSNMKFEKNAIDTLLLSKMFLSNLRSKSLSSMCNHYSIVRENEHRALDDAIATYKLFRYLENEFCNMHTQQLFMSKPLHWKPKKGGEITKKQAKFLTDLSFKHNIELDKPIKEFTKSEASKKIDMIINEYGR